MRAAAEERVLLVNNARRSGENNRDGIEANLVPGNAGAGSVSAGGADDLLLFLTVDGAFGVAELGGGARFYFDEYDDVAVAGDDVYFGIAFVRPVIASNDMKSRAF